MEAEKKIKETILWPIRGRFCHAAEEIIALQDRPALP